MNKNDFLALTPDERDAYIAKRVEVRQERINRPENKRKAARAAEMIAAGQRISVDLFEALTGIMFSHSMTGKMLNILSLSTNCLMNPVCMARIEAGIGICAECFAASLNANYDGTFENTAYNTKVLSSMIIPLEILPVIDADELRIESLGDTQNWKQAANYMNFARVNPLVSVTAWTKNPGHYLEAIRRGYSKPENFTLIFSSIDLNTPAEIPEKFTGIIDKRFTVYTLEWLDENGIGPAFINCGGRSCKDCERCYKNAEKTGFDVRELLKKDAKKAAKRGGGWSEWTDNEEATEAAAPEKVENILKMFEAFKAA